MSTIKSPELPDDALSCYDAIDHRINILSHKDFKINENRRGIT